MTTIKVYMKDGRVFEYDVEDAKAREHAGRIVTEGYRNLTGDMMEYYPVHTVFKVTFKMTAPDTQATQYKAVVK